MPKKRVFIFFTLSSLLRAILIMSMREMIIILISFMFIVWELAAHGHWSDNYNEYQGIHPMLDKANYA